MTIKEREQCGELVEEDITISHDMTIKEREQ